MEKIAKGINCVASHLQAVVKNNGIAHLHHNALIAVRTAAATKHLKIAIQTPVRFLQAVVLKIKMDLLNKKRISGKM